MDNLFEIRDLFAYLILECIVIDKQFHAFNI